MGSTAVMNLMLGWLKGVANWVLSLFDLAGSTGFSPIAWLADNWLTALIVLLITGVVMDLLVWLIRWRPHWVWFNKKRIVIHEDDFFEGEDLVDSGLYEPELFDTDDAIFDTDTTVSKPQQSSRRRRPQPIPGKRRTRPVDFENDDIFSIDGAGGENADAEDDVFNVSDLPVSDDEIAYRNSRKRS